MIAYEVDGEHECIDCVSTAVDRGRLGEYSEAWPIWEGEAEAEDHVPTCATCGDEIDGFYVYSTCLACGKRDDTDFGEVLDADNPEAYDADERYKAALVDEYGEGFFCRRCQLIAEEAAYEIEDANVGANVCDMCGGELYDLGRLGNRQHQRCRQCGAECSYVVAES